MTAILAEAGNSKWFVRLDDEENPTSLTLYNFVGAKFEAHSVQLHNEQDIIYWIERIYHLDHIREVFEGIVFGSDFPDQLFIPFCETLCRLRDKK